MLPEIIAHKEKLLASIDLKMEIKKIESQLETYPAVRSLRLSLLAEADIAIIAEIKKQSPSKGILNNKINVEKMAKLYESAGARAISVLTEDKYFGGTVEDLITARRCIDIPVLRKDFILHEYQVWQSRAIGADAILLIAAVLPGPRVSELYSLARQIGLEVIIEVHSREEIEKVLSIEPEMIGINNRNLKTFETDIRTFEQLSPLIPDGTVLIAESGIFKRADVIRLKRIGADAALIGEAILSSADPEKKILELRGEII